MPPNKVLSPAADEAARSHAEAQRQRILDAAQQCFIGRGFHAGSISEIAAEANISQGLMYRYFDNKRTLILALIERQLAHDQEAMRHPPAPADLVESLLVCYQHWARGETLETRGSTIASVVLFAQINAEAHRDPVIAEVVRNHDKQIGEAIAQWLRRHDQERGRALDEGAIQQRVLLLRLLVEGAAMRAVRNPDVSEFTLRGVLTDLIAHALPD
ncbi:TetR/AcrR family transcriptional regulator [uncultured Stenotrophomonas sp.]|uniref:TetR/AcrR family transcriptional regulator n=1 Tax=uncultured Stenotrophomonas sp. TaxID=165438 RepID=UPI0025D734B4|nr:TetR/AcrR family transcriptional regulator [uncultured Stenotrophomonas sp.]